MSVENNIPAIRFKGFSGEWEEREMLDCSSKIGDGLHGTPEYVDDSGIYFINGNNLISGSIFITDGTKQVHKGEQSKDDNALGFNTILMSINGTIGNLAWYRGEKVMLGKSVAYITLENCDNAYMFCYLQTKRVNNYFYNNLTGSTIKNLGLKAIRETVVFIPYIEEEQTKIGNYFQQLDTLISQHQQKHDKLLNLKKSLLEKMFPKQGKDEPEIRFKGFSGAWEEKALGDISDVRDGTHDSPQYFSEGYPFVTSKNVKNGFINFDDVQYISKNDFDEINKRSKVDINDVLMGMIGTIGNIALIREPVNFAIKNVALIKDKKNGSYLYVYIFLQSPTTLKQLEEGMEGGTQKFISLNRIRTLLIVMPKTKTEQTKIGNFFKHLDTLLTQHQSQLKKLKQIKQACLAKMFV